MLSRRALLSLLLKRQQQQQLAAATCGRDGGIGRWAWRQDHGEEAQQQQRQQHQQHPPPLLLNRAFFSLGGAEAAAAAAGAAAAAAASGLAATPAAAAAAAAAAASSSSAAAATAAATATTSSATLLLAAASAAESSTGGAVGPIVLATQAWELAHAASGLPWWLSIPATALVLRTALLPLTLKAKGAAANFALLRHASVTAGAALRQEAEEEKEQETQRQRQQKGVGKTMAAPEGKTAVAAAPTKTSSSRRWALTRGYYALLRRQHGTPSMWWYNLNVFAQVNVFVSMSAALRQMAGAAWPGLSSEGALWFPDLTAPSVALGTWATPLGVAGLLLPLGVLATYMASVDRAAPVAQSRAARAALEVAALPVFLAALCVPQATLLYWLPSSALQLGVQRALDARPRLAARLGVPLLAMRPEGSEAQAEMKGLAAARAGELVASAAGGKNGDAEFLRFLAADRLSRGDVAGALLALERLTSAGVAPGDAEGWRARGALAARLGRWPEAARAFERAAEGELSASGGEAAATAAGAGAAGRRSPPTPEEAARLRRALLVRAGTAHLNAISQLGGGGVAEAPPSAAAPTLSPEQRRHLDAALAALNRATAGLEAAITTTADDDARAAATAEVTTTITAAAAPPPGDAAFDAWVALGAARVLARQWRPAGDAAARAWQALSLGGAEQQQQQQQQQRARQLLPLLRRVVGRAAESAVAEAEDAGAAQRLASAARAAAGAAALAGPEGRDAADGLAEDLRRVADAVRRRGSGGGGGGGEAQLAAVERAAETLAALASASAAEGA